jgi:hypothetical protein
VSVLEGDNSVYATACMRDRVIRCESHRTVQYTYSGGAPLRTWPRSVHGTLSTSRSGALLFLREPPKDEVVPVLYRLDPDTAERARLLDGLFPGNDSMVPPKLVTSPDERRLAVALDDCGTAVLELATTTLTRLDHLPADTLPLEWDAEGLIVGEAFADEAHPMRLWRASGEPLAAMIWASPDNARRVRLHAEGYELDRGDGWQLVRLAVDAVRQLHAFDLRRPPWLGSARWLLHYGSRVLELDTGEIWELGPTNRVEAAHPDGSIVVVAGGVLGAALVRVTRP